MGERGAFGTANEVKHVNYLKACKPTLKGLINVWNLHK